MSALGFVLSYSLQIALLSAAGLAATRAMRGAEPRVRLAAHQLLLGVALLGPLVPLSRLAPASARPIAGDAWLGVQTVASTAEASGAPLGSILMMVLAAGAVWRLARATAGLAVLRRARREGRPLPGNTAAAIAGRRLAPAGVEILISPRVAVPMAFGLRSPCVLLPPSFTTLPGDQQRAVLCHELLHLERRDWAVGMLEEALRVAFWFHPLVSVLLGRISACREQVVDRLVAQRTQNVRAYVEALFAVAAARSAPLPGAISLLRQHELVERIRLLRQEDFMKGKSLVGTVVIAVPILFVTLVLAGGAFPLPVEAQAQRIEALAPPPESSQDEAEPIFVTGDAQQPEKISGDLPVYPEIAKEARVQGITILRAVIDKEGAVGRLKILKRLPMGMTESAIDAVRTWRYRPATLDGDPVAVYFNVTVNFELRECAEEGSDCPEPDV